MMTTMAYIAYFHKLLSNNIEDGDLNNVTNEYQKPCTIIIGVFDDMSVDILGEWKSRIEDINKQFW